MVAPIHPATFRLWVEHPPMRVLAVFRDDLPKIAEAASTLGFGRVGTSCLVLPLHPTISEKFPADANMVRILE